MTVQFDDEVQEPRTIGFIGLPSLGLQFEIVDQLDAGPTHTNGSSLPGHRGTCVVGAHRTGPFLRLGELTAGDEILVGVTADPGDGRHHRYVVVGAPVVVHEYDPLLGIWRKELFDRLGIPDGEIRVPSYRRLMLITCSAADGRADPEDNTHRIVVLADFRDAEMTEESVQ
jgi:sortase (surface protein transpeptidase)